MKIIKNLKGESEDAPYSAGWFHRVSIANTSSKGYARYIQLSNTDLVIQRKDAVVKFNLSDLIALAESVEPLLIAPEDKKPTNGAATVGGS
jgi:hypothetical protein